ncbi:MULTISPECIES: CoA ester lyase [unclassified Arthrobacter]|uniref:HpcH/HpaI aldolase/citrate lyase family protein n=1 Tax=unclassified Arthrobacter TaxID=235627 RepID=UPI001D1428C3|nr:MULTISPECIES: aldolase/citrate lyase family protein [unclassified Arthrobacter]MCC3289857.1 CoA ester lyase [Arthrobacter sp. zg-Y1110]MCC3300640.1 CoA ester lyase [Arthrobacter sp. zg-Y895]MCQ1946018.1 aldolase/citrate lyase family protein [Arthrobacter sp. zg-Y1116]MCQ1985956.1 aldolase/citrate lyase family protein [Arthrobacter sp. zg-Y844]MCQ1994302.1 aldolase/citrate lyase family protein [Arthrobacter sp. zg-Y1171]
MAPFRNSRAAALPAKLSRSWLLASAADEANFAPALASEADSVVFDMEDAVPAGGKAEARERVVEALSTGMTAWVRVNGIETEYWADDLAALSKAPGLRGVMLAMTEKPEQVTHTAMRLQAGTPVLALVESALGIENATAIASAPGTFRLAFGVGDFRRDTGASDDPMALAYARSKLVVASRVGQLPGPIDGPTVGALGEKLLDACKVTQSMGMTGKLCLMPEATDFINQGLSPSGSEITWAHELLEAHAAGAVVGDGSYLPRLARAQKISSLADSYGLWNA